MLLPCAILAWRGSDADIVVFFNLDTERVEEKDNKPLTSFVPTKDPGPGEAFVDWCSAQWQRWFP
jgi:hypothetical protein